jgi:hypothetical protein
MQFRTRWVAGPVLAASLTAAGLAATSASATARPAVKSYTSTAVTKVSDRPDSGDHGNWANDTLVRSASVTLASEVALSYCGGSAPTGHCYHWTGKITDKGSFTTVPGDTSPGNGSLNGGSAPAIGAQVTGAMSGSYRYDFYSSWKSASKTLVPSSENDQGNVPGGRQTTGAWPEQFFGAGARFYVSGAASSELGTTGSWTYTAGFGADSACPAVASQWTDASPDWGANAADGNILAPAAAAC